MKIRAQNHELWRFTKEIPRCKPGLLVNTRSSPVSLLSDRRAAFQVSPALNGGHEWPHDSLIQMSSSLFIVDDHPVFRQGLAEAIATCPDLRLIGEAGSARAAFPLIERDRPDLVILDLALPGMDGISAT